VVLIFVLIHPNSLLLGRLGLVGRWAASGAAMVFATVLQSTAGPVAQREFTVLACDLGAHAFEIGGAASALCANSNSTRFACAVVTILLAKVTAQERFPALATTKGDLVLAGYSCVTE